MTQRQALCCDCRVSGVGVWGCRGEEGSGEDGGMKDEEGSGRQGKRETGRKGLEWEVHAKRSKCNGCKTRRRRGRGGGGRESEGWQREGCRGGRLRRGSQNPS